MRFVSAIPGLALLSAVVGCSGSSSTGAAVVGTPVDAATAGSIEVQVTYAGAAPVPKTIDMRAVPQCAAAHREPVLDQSLVVKDGKLANAVVWIKSGLETWVFSTPAEPVSIDQKGCIYEPRVAAAMVGQTVRFKNSDPEAHNVHGRPKVVDAWNFIMSRPGATRDLSFNKPEIAVPIGCDVHPWMSGHLAILSNPFFGVTSTDGTVKLANVPPGEYVIGAWHETLGSREKKVSLPPRGSEKLQLELSAAK